jgi:hypothetical protein
MSQPKRGVISGSCGLARRALHHVGSRGLEGESHGGKDVGDQVQPEDLQTRPRGIGHPIMIAANTVTISPKLHEKR